MVQYRVSGKTAKELLKDLQRKSPPPPFGGVVRYFASAESNFRWDYSLRMEGGRCVVDSYDVAVDTRYTIPYWEDRDGAPARLAAYWGHFMDRLWVHEEGHADIALTMAMDVAKALKPMKTFDSCEEAHPAVKAAAESVLKEHGARQRAYDRETEHGRKQGAVFDVREAAAFKPKKPESAGGEN